MGGGGGGSGPTLQQQQLQAQQALATANLNLEENAQRKAILNAMQGTRVFRGSALSRAIRGDTPGGEPKAAPSAAQSNAGSLVPPSSSLLDQRGSGSTPAGGTGASNVGDNGGGLAGISPARVNGGASSPGAARAIVR